MNNNIQCETIYSLRSVPVAVYKVNNLISLKNKNTIQGYNNWYTSDLEQNNVELSHSYNFLEEYNMQDILSNINKCISIYSQDILGADIKLKPVGSWVTKQTNNGIHNSHYHPNTLLSAVTYFKEPAGDISSLIFNNNGLDDVFPHFKGFTLSKKITSWNIFNNLTYKIKPEVDQVIIFPGHLVHRSDTTTDEGTRYCIGVNYFLDDTLGDISSKSAITISC